MRACGPADVAVGANSFALSVLKNAASALARSPVLVRTSKQRRKLARGRGAISSAMPQQRRGADRGGMGDAHLRKLGVAAKGALGNDGADQPGANGVEQRLD